MKMILLVLLTAFTTIKSFSRTDTSRVEQYSEIIATPRLLSNRVTIEVNYGEEQSLWKDNRLKSRGGKLKKFNLVIDALNFMGKEGWVFVNAFPVNIGTTQVYHYGFKKTFLRSEVN